MALGVSDGYDATSGEIQAGYLMQSTELECGHAFGRQMAWSYVSCPDVMARVSVSSLVEITTAAKPEPTPEDSGPYCARWDWIRHRSGGIAAASSFVVGLGFDFAAFR